MKKNLLFLGLGIFFLCLSACSSKKDTEVKTVENVTLDTNVVKKDTTPIHQDIRLKFNDIQLASAANEFKGGTNLEGLKNLFGEPMSHETVPAGSVSVDLYTWNFDQVSLRVHIYQDSSIVRSISNFQFNREETITKSDVDALKISQENIPGDSFKAISDKLGQPDVMSQAVSSEKEEIQAVWTSGLKTDSGATLILDFENNALVRVEQNGIKD
ncbi:MULTISPECIES: DUF3862 domain-containing protein [Streptococcus]|uniref:DUF3862 domain-containing protein n=1 Tax=Streptococcus caledonicus TaxID=2614158 RepID=A0ABW0UDF6_9STRE|nr:DUF3862 domain-containing protein [Streptococcus sp. S784/96/1]